LESAHQHNLPTVAMLLLTRGFQFSQIRNILRYSHSPPQMRIGRKVSSLHLCNDGECDWCESLYSVSVTAANFSNVRLCLKSFKAHSFNTRAAVHFRWNWLILRISW